ncbi:MAG: 30S ribosomal protein S3 [Methanobacteriota archaeon]|nr:MAG: 30S ribosomal protein S3 [Euryarchaeota archaeon]
MAIERKFVQDNLQRAEISEYIAKELERSGCGGMEIQKTPLGTRVTVFAERPGMVIGRRGRSIRKLTETLERRFHLENPHIEVKELAVKELNPQVMANQIARALERGRRFRRVAYTTIRRIREAGARGVEIVISGKVAKSRSRSMKFIDGYIKKCGDPAVELVRKGYAVAQLKPGVIGVKVSIMPPDVSLPDEFKLKEDETAALGVGEEAEQAEATQTSSSPGGEVGVDKDLEGGDTETPVVGGSEEPPATGSGSAGNG